MLAIQMAELNLLGWAWATIDSRMRLGKISDMKRALMLVLALLTFGPGCANRSRWDSPPVRYGSAANTRAAVHDPFPLNDIGPEVVGAVLAVT